jgi:hypothetical protein
MSSLYQFLGEISDYAFGATVELGRNAFVKRGHLRDAKAATN